MRVSLVATETEFAGPHGAGVHRYVHELYKNIIQIKHDDVVIEKTAFKPLPIIREGLTPTIMSLFYDFGGYDVIHNLAPRPIYPIRGAKAILATTAHEFRALLYPGIPRFEDRASIRRILGLQLVIKAGEEDCLKSDYISAQSTQTRDEAIKLGFDKKNIFIINHGIDDRFIKRPLKGKTNKKFRVGYISALVSTKNVDFAIKAFNRMNKPDSVFEIWGKYLNIRYYNYLQSLAKGNQVQFMGFAPEDNIINIYDSFDAFVYPTLYEGLGLPMLEAQARGVPTIVYADGKIPKEVTRYCFKAKDEEHMAEILEKLKDNGYNEKTRHKAAIYARKFSWRNTAVKTLEMYDKITSK